MRTVNKVIIIGNVTRDPAVKNTDGGKKVALFTLATNRYFKSWDGENKSESEFHNCVAWGNLADRVEKFLVKGKLIYVEGRLRTRGLDRDDGTKSYKTEIVVTNLIFLNKRSDFEWEEDAGAHSDELDTIENDDKF